jgi:hypothetical protein
MDLLTTILCGVAGYFAIGWKSEKDKNDKRNDRKIERLERWARQAGSKVGIEFVDDDSAD